MDIQQAIRNFVPQDACERENKAALLADLARYGEGLFLRTQEDAHLTASGFILDPEMRETLMVYHLIYQSFSWTGGHADGETDLLSVALREAKEETGVTEIWPLSGQILSIDRFWVPAHQKHGRAVKAHVHYSVAYGLIAPKNQTLTVKSDENSAVEWIAESMLEENCQEKKMIPVYRKIWARMQAINAERATLYARLPGALLPWYKEHARNLPWRQDREPYHVWVSEIMLQQTRVEAVKGYYARFLAVLPTVEALADVEEEKLLKLWEGLGYYSRARNLQKAAREIMTRYGGRFPDSYDGIRALPGVGDYTAGAIASICLELPIAAVDGNVIRVLSRILERFDPSGSPALKKRLAASLEAVYPIGNCGNFTQSLMELGATVCTPNGAPKCALCPAGSFCRAFQHGTVGLLPAKQPKKPRRTEQRTVFVYFCEGKLAVRRRKARGLLAGCWELPNCTGWLSEQEAAVAAGEDGVYPVSLDRALQKKHIFTHMEWEMVAYFFSCKAESDCFRWVTKAELQEEIALPTAFRMFLSDL